MNAPLSPAIRAFLDGVQEMLDAKPWPALDRERMTTTIVHDAAHVVLVHRAEATRNIEMTVGDREVEIAYRPEHIRFARPDEALRFLEMLGDGRVELVVRRNPVWTSMRSYRDGLALPFHASSHPWLNRRFGTERVRFGFD